MELVFDEYRVKRLLNVHKHVDGPWFWGRYSAHPYVGCRAGCEFCYSRGTRYLGRRDPAVFDRHIRVKVNAAERLRKELPKQPVEGVGVGDWQAPAERRYRLSRSLLEVLLELGYPAFVVERSPLLVRDLDLLSEIDRQTWAAVAWSMSNVDPAVKRAFEPRSPGIGRRLKAMQAVADAGILVGTTLMPVIPYVGDSPRQLEDVVVATKDHGGTFVIASGLTLDGAQADRSLAALRAFEPEAEPRWRKLYGWAEGGEPSYGPHPRYATRLGLFIRELCDKHGLRDRMPRPVLPGPLAANKRIAERLLVKSYDLELEQASRSRIWAYRRAGWTVDEWPESVADLFREGGREALQRLPGVGVALSGLMAGWLSEAA